MIELRVLLTSTLLRAAALPAPRGYLDRVASWLAAALIASYRMTLSGRIGAQCMFQPSCSENALALVKARGWHNARDEIARRLRRCNGVYVARHDGESFEVVTSDGHICSESQLSETFLAELRRNHRHRVDRATPVKL
jgi:putative component of membrane protein insertase Oxa1/YidC/SpoIIIJ protein YidD